MATSFHHYSCPGEGLGGSVLRPNNWAAIDCSAGVRENRALSGNVPYGMQQLSRSLEFLRIEC